ncbi:UPF0158 family protein [Thalassobacillus sp. CUG 92003]|uniref:UPF0158 family protein n=1 Tax=Thalassobacillus sp. CUG 92003 TaxID=2736641 RepID=UPI0015E64235|nr:UPF0158 family protein [Thalassobacillus sp. CUG 92003]
MRANLQDIVDHIDMSQYDFLACFDKQTYAPVAVTLESYRAAEEEKPFTDFPYWQHKELQLATEMEEDPERFISLPDHFDIDDYRIMEAFCFTTEENKRNQLLNCVRGKGAFRRFKDKINLLGIVDDWYAYKNEQYLEIAKEWCEAHGIKW